MLGLKYQKKMCHTVCVVVFLVLGSLQLEAQIPPPGYNRELRELEESRRTSVLERDSCIVTDTVTMFDPTTYEESIRVIKSTLSWRDYMSYRLGINRPEELLDGAPKTIMDPKTYTEITIRWNAGATKLDTIGHK